MLVLVSTAPKSWLQKLYCSISLLWKWDISILSRFSWTCELLEMPKETFKTTSELLLLLPEAVGYTFGFNPTYEVMNFIVK